MTKQTGPSPQTTSRGDRHRKRIKPPEPKQIRARIPQTQTEGNPGTTGRERAQLRDPAHKTGRQVRPNIQATRRSNQLAICKNSRHIPTPGKTANRNAQSKSKSNRRRERAEPDNTRHLQQPRDCRHHPAKSEGHTRPGRRPTKRGKTGHQDKPASSADSPEEQPAPGANDALQPSGTGTGPPQNRPAHRTERPTQHPTSPTEQQSGAQPQAGPRSALAVETKNRGPRARTQHRTDEGNNSPHNANGPHNAIPKHLPTHPRHGAATMAPNRQLRGGRTQAPRRKAQSGVQRNERGRRLPVGGGRRRQPTKPRPPRGPAGPTASRPTGRG